MHGSILIIAFLVSLGFMLVSIIKYKLHPFLALLIACLIMGFMSGMAPMTILAKIGEGFGGIMAEIGIIIFLGVILGQILHDTGCTKEIAHTMLAAVGAKNAPTALNLTGYILCIPVFMDVAFIILISLVKQLSVEGKIALNVLVTAFVVGLMCTHAMVIPTPGPVAVAGVFGANIGWFIVYGVIVAVTGSIFGGLIYTRWLAKHPVWVRDEEFLKDSGQAEVEDRSNKPSGVLGIFFILLPILLIILAKILSFFTVEGSAAHTAVAFCGDTVTVLIFTVLLVFFCLRKHLKKSFENVVTDAAGSMGAILAIIGAGGAFGTVIAASGLGDHIVVLLRGWNMPIIILGFLLAMFLHAGLGSVTVALVTSSAVAFPVAMQMGADPVLCGLAICAGGMGMGLPSDSGFWTVGKFAQFTTKETFFVYTIPLTIASVGSLIAILILDAFKGVLPGLG